MSEQQYQAEKRKHGRFGGKILRKQNNRKIGEEKEAFVCEWLEKQGYRIVERNFRCRSGEVDIVARENRYLVFIEVKYRKGAECGDPSEAVDYHKQQTISKVALFYLLRNGYTESTPVRFDVVTVSGTDAAGVMLYRNAFEYCG